MNDPEDPLPEAERPIKTTQNRHPAGSVLIFLNVVLLLLSGSFLFLIATSSESEGAFTKARWEQAIKELRGLPAHLRGQNASHKDGQSQDTPASPGTRATELSEAISSLSSELSRIEKSIKPLGEGPESTLARATEVSGQLEQLSEQLAQARESIANASKLDEPGVVPELLEDFLLEARQPGYREKLEHGGLDRTRVGLVDLINQLPGSHRDGLREEIRDANWLLEAHEILSGQFPQTFEDQLGQYVSLTLLNEDQPEGVPDETLVDLDKRAADLTKGFESNLDTLVAAFEVPNPTISEELLTNSAILADTLAADLDETRRNLPAWIQQWQEWQEEVGKHLSKKDEADPGRKIQLSNQLLQQGRLLEQDLLAYGLPKPAKFSAGLESLRSSLVEAEQSAVGKYQLWALNEIQAARSLAGEKAVKAISEALSLGKSDPVAAEKNKRYQKLIRENPVFRAKLLELTGLGSEEDFRLTTDTARQISEKLDALTGWKGSADLALCLNRDLLEQRLLPIEEGLLRRPIDSLYSEVFQECWQYLEGSPLRVEVAKTAATIEKRQIEQP